MMNSVDKGRTVEKQNVRTYEREKVCRRLVGDSVERCGPWPSAAREQCAAPGEGKFRGALDATGF